MSLLFCQFLSAVGVFKKDCRHILRSCRLSVKPLGRPLRNEIIPNNEFEMLSVDIKKPNSKAFNITAAYRPPSCTVGFFEALEAIVRIIDMESKEQIILGDLNCNY